MLASDVVLYFPNQQVIQSNICMSVLHTIRTFVINYKALGLRVACLFTSQYKTKGYDTITDVIKLLVGSTSCWLDRGITPPTIFRFATWFWRQP